MPQPHSLTELIVYLVIIWLWCFGIIFAGCKFLKNDKKKNHDIK